MAVPSEHQAHELPLADRLVTDHIRRWLNTAIATELAGYGDLNPEEQAARKAVEQVRHLALADYSYALVPRILDDLRRAGLLNESADAHR
ncbi:hypothetical protein IQ62_01145 [Streptomyces scabiei]|uniref:hypothetical protein n=1 Tax=Streptomyces scabiei TaxID=1930 RepID=UPI0004E68CF0|nr:hypothetical protein [Streptomyces scabiei]KFG02579.1 hypothetical protein IQ62_01145 [Streptomyces scabiei]